MKMLKEIIFLIADTDTNTEMEEVLINLPFRVPFNWITFKERDKVLLLTNIIKFDAGNYPSCTSMVTNF